MIHSVSAAILNICCNLFSHTCLCVCRYVVGLYCRPHKASGLAQAPFSGVLQNREPIDELLIKCFCSFSPNSCLLHSHTVYLRECSWSLSSCIEIITQKKWGTKKSTGQGLRTEEALKMQLEMLLSQGDEGQSSQKQLKSAFLKNQADYTLRTHRGFGGFFVTIIFV